jgi:hypothetical protein
MYDMDIVTEDETNFGPRARPRPRYYDNLLQRDALGENPLGTAVTP